MHVHVVVNVNLNLVTWCLYLGKWEVHFWMFRRLLSVISKNIWTHNELSWFWNILPCLCSFLHPVPLLMSRKSIIKNVSNLNQLFRIDLWQLYNYNKLYCQYTMLGPNFILVWFRICHQFITKCEALWPLVWLKSWQWQDISLLQSPSPPRCTNESRHILCWG